MHEGYQIHVYQPGYLDYCNGHDAQIASCHTFLSTGIAPLESINLPILVEAQLIMRTFGSLSKVWRLFGGYYNTVVRTAVRNGDLSPRWIPGSPHLSSADGVRVLDIFARDVANAAPGSLYFAHILLPHAPYVYDRRCNLRDPHNWVDRPDPVPRLERYRLYLEQIECTSKRLERAFDLWRRAGVLDGALVVIHGDHGSRLYLNEPTVDNRHELRESDYLDSFSTLLALKAPDLEPRYDRRMVAIQDALEAVADGEPSEPPDVEAGKPFVLLRNMRGPQMIQRRMP